ncbi:MAG TPA: T9SS type A sorting domain-containing protein [Saprospiraceae bacterium]|nr:T9SS type A sorting domain-containing protein [Saprospiraceae bacterium]HRK80731.1 T9SS type A sorting domain-containing protein [Saprospiraceae bacterium]
MKRLFTITFCFAFLAMAVHLNAQQLISSQYKGMVSQAQLALQYGPLMQNGVRMYKITYTTPDVFGQQDTASGLLVVPIRPGFTLPLLCYQHGTLDGPNDAPSALAGGYQLALVFGGLGYVTAAPDLLGIGESRGFHPYVHAESTASASLDMLRATKQYAAENALSLNNQLFITGYSQGGYSAMALYKDIQENHAAEFTVTAAAPMSGPYSISGVMRDAILSDQVYLYPAYVPNTLLSYNYVYNLYSSTQQFLKEPYATMAQNYFDRQITLSQLNGMLIQQLTTDFGASIPRNMLQDSIVAAVIANPNHPVNVALRDNDVHDWAPQAPTRLFYCRADDQVNYLNSVVADSMMQLNGAPNVQALDVNTNADHGGCVQPAVFNTAFFFGQYQSITVTTSTTATPVLENVRLSPNPAGSVFRVENAPIGAMLEIFDHSGRRLKSQSIQNTMQPVETNGISRGVYFVCIRSEQGNWYGKVLIQ